MQGSKLEAHLFGLDPYTSYSMCVVAVNTAGSHSSPWASTHTLEASPGGLANLTTEQREDGRALLLHWAEPSSPNGVMKVRPTRVSLKTCGHIHPLIKDTHLRMRQYADPLY